VDLVGISKFNISKMGKSGDGKSENMGGEWSYLWSNYPIQSLSFSRGSPHYLAVGIKQQPQQQESGSGSGSDDGISGKKEPDRNPLVELWDLRKKSVIQQFFVNSQDCDNISVAALVWNKHFLSIGTLTGRLHLLTFFPF
jgi:hypothetical protein